MAGLSGALAGLSAAYPGYVQGRVNENTADMSDLQLAEAKRSPLGQVALANALRIMAEGGGDTQSMGQPSPQAPMPGQPSQPMVPPGGGQPSPPSPGGAPQGASPPGGGSILGGVPGFRPGETIMGNPSPASQVAQRFPGPGGAPPMPQGAPQPGGGMPLRPPMPSGMPMGGQIPGTMDWKQIVGSIVKANPDAPPDVIASAISQAMKLPQISQEGRMSMQMLALQLREQDILRREEAARQADETRRRGQDIGLERAVLSNSTRMQLSKLSIEARTEIERQRQEGRLDLANLSQATRLQIAGLNNEAKAELFGQAEAGRDRRLGETEAGKDRRTVQKLQGQPGGAQIPARQLFQKGVEEFIANNGREPTYEETQKILAGTRPQTATQQKTEERSKQVDILQKQISSIENDVANSMKGGTGVTGFMGAANRIKEVAMNLAGMSDEVVANQFQSKLVLLKPQMMDIIRRRGYIPAAQWAEFDKGLRGLSPGSTKQDTVASLNYLARVLDLYKGEKTQSPTAAKGPKASVPASQADDGWKIERVGP